MSEHSISKQAPVVATRARARPLSLAGVLTGVRVMLLLLLAVIMVVPLLFMLLAATKTNDALVTPGNSLSFGSLANAGQAWANVFAYNGGEVASWVVNSVIYTGATLLLSLILCVPAGYALATWRFRGRGPLLFLTLLAMIMPAAALVLPLFLEINLLHLVNTYWSVILPSSFFPFGVYLTYIFFATSMPRDLLAASRIDGCSEAGVFWYIALPLSRPIFALVAFFSFVANWNNFFLPFVMLTDDSKFNLPVGLTAMVQTTGAITANTGQTFMPVKRPEVALTGLIMIVPIVLIFIFSQRFVQAGFLVGAEKG